jgi:heme-degrading monooxygenase HmoA
VVVRLWRGWTMTRDADRYERHYRSHVLATLRQVPGFRGAHLLRREVGEETEFVSLTFFEDLEAIRAFTGKEYDAAVVAGEARQVLVRYDARARHYDLAFEGVETGTGQP